MPKSNFERMLLLAQDSFNAHADPNQLQVDETVIEQLKAIHPSCVAEMNDEGGPIAWILLIPTTMQIMYDFVSEKISETEILNQADSNSPYESMYLCSAMVLPEYQQKGIATRLTLDAIQQIQMNHHITTLFVWPFSEAGKNLANQIAQKTGLPILMRKSNID